MGVTKTEKFSKEQNQLAQMMKALAHPARIAILEVLIGKNSCVCGEIVDEVPLSQSTISQHLKELKESGIIIGTIEGPKVCYCINPEMWDELAIKFSSFLRSYDKSCC